MPRAFTLPRALAPSRHPLLSALLLVPPQPVPPAQRLIVLVPDVDFDQTRFAHQLFELAREHHPPLLLLTRVGDHHRVFSARRQLATLAALTRDEHSVVDTHLFMGGWVEAVRSFWQPGDLVVGHLEQKFTTWAGVKPLAEELIACLQTPVYLLAGFYPIVQPDESPYWQRAVLFDVGAAGILVGFLALQVELLQVAPDWLSKVLLCLSVGLEFILIGGWHFYFSQGVEHD